MMNPNMADFNSHAIAPVDCVKEGWAMIKENYWLFFGITLVGMLIGKALVIVLMGPMMCGIFLCLLQQQRGERVEFGVLFKGFDFFLQGFLVQLIKLIPIIVLMVPFYVIMLAVMFAMPRGQARPEEMGGFMATFFGFEIIFILVLAVVAILIELCFMFAFPLVVDRKLKAIDAMKLSFAACKANFGGVLGLLLLNALFGFIGVLCCFVGVYFYLPVSFASYVVAYRRVFPDISQSFPSPPPPPASWA